MPEPSTEKSDPDHEIGTRNGEERSASRKYKTEDTVQGIPGQQRSPGAGKTTRDEAPYKILELQVSSFSFVRSILDRHRVQEHGGYDGRHPHQIKSGTDATKAQDVDPRMVSTINGMREGVKEYGRTYVRTGLKARFRCKVRMRARATVIDLSR